MDFTKKFGSRNPEHSAEWVELDGAKFLIAAINNLAYMQWAQRRFTVDQLTDIQKGSYSAIGESAADVFDTMADGFSECVLLNWEGLTRDDEPLPYSKETARELLSYPQFFDWVRQQSDEIAAKKNASKGVKEKKIK